MTEVFVATTVNPNPEKAAVELAEQMDSCDFYPDLLLFYPTVIYKRKYEEMLAILRKRFARTSMSGCVVDGFLKTNEIFSTGAMLVGLKVDGEIYTVLGNRGSVEDTLKHITSRADYLGINDADIVMLHFPGFSVGDTKNMSLMLMKSYLEEKYVSLLKDKETKKRLLHDMTHYFLEKRHIYPINDVLEYLSGAMPAAIIMAICSIPYSLGANTPIVFSNFKVARRGISAVFLRFKKRRINAKYGDVFPKNTGSVEKNIQKILNSFTFTYKCTLVKEGCFIESINGFPVNEFLKRTYFLKEALIEEPSYCLKHDQTKTQTGTVLMIFNERTQGATPHRLYSNFPLKSHISVVKLDSYLDSGIIFLEPGSEKLDKIFGIFDKLSPAHINLMWLDSSLIHSFGAALVDRLNTLPEYDGFGIFVNSPSIYLPPKHRLQKMMTEVGKGIYITTCGASFLLTIK